MGSGDEGIGAVPCRSDVQQRASAQCMRSYLLCCCCCWLLQALSPWIATTWLHNLPYGQDSAMALASVCEDTNPACR